MSDVEYTIDRDRSNPHSIVVLRDGMERETNIKIADSTGTDSEYIPTRLVLAASLDKF